MAGRPVAWLPFEAAVSPAQILDEHHYLGAHTRGTVYQDDGGVLVFANPNTRWLPADTWLELVRWCILNGEGSAQWKRARRWLMATYPHVTTVVSYSDPSVGHTGALYRASNWLWAPTWHRLREPPTGNGQWTAGRRQAAKDRWVDPLRPDASRAKLLTVKDDAVMAKLPWASYVEPRWKRGHRSGGGGNYARWRLLTPESE